MAKIHTIIEAAGGTEAVANRSGVSIRGVQKWTQTGVPDWHWQSLIDLSGAALEEIYEANRELRLSRNKETAA